MLVNYRMSPIGFRIFRCQKCSIGKLIIYAGGEYKILHRQFFDRNTLQNSFINKKK